MADPVRTAPAWANQATRYSEQEGLRQTLRPSHHTFLQCDLNPPAGLRLPFLLERCGERPCGEAGALPGVHQGGQAACYFGGTAARAATRTR